MDCGHLGLEAERKEVYEWYMVSDYLANALVKRGACVLIDENICGRECTGQAILLDFAISQICYDSGILEGQQYEWEVA